MIDKLPSIKTINKRYQPVKPPKSASSYSSSISNSSSRSSGSSRSKNTNSSGLKNRSLDVDKVDFDPHVVVKEVTPNQRVTSASYVQLDVGKVHPKLFSPPPSADLANVDEQLANLAQDSLRLNNYVSSSNEKTQNHWLVYPQEQMPNYIIEAKKRLGQIKQPNLAPNQQKLPSKPNSASSSKSFEKENLKKIILETNGAESFKPSESVVSEPARKSPLANSKEIHWLSWEKPETPEKIRQIRKRLGDDRYRNMRSATSSQLELRSKLESINIENNKNIDNINENSNLKITNTVLLSDDSSNNINTANINIVNEPYKIPEANLELTNKITISYPPSTTQNDVFGGILPVDDNIITNGKVNQILNDSSIYQPVEPIETNNEIRSKSKLANTYTVNTDNNGTLTLESWMQTANEQDKNAILKLIKDIDGRTSTSRFNESRLSNYSVKSSNRRSVSRAASAKLPTTRVLSAAKSRPITPQVRKLGTTRNNFYFPNENSEKELIQQYLWGELNPASVNYGYNF